MPAQMCVPLACTLTIHGHRRAMASGSLRVGSFSWEEPQAEEEGESLLEDGTLQPRPKVPSLPSVPSPASPAVAHTQAVILFSHRNLSFFVHENGSLQLLKGLSAAQVPLSLLPQTGGPEHSQPPFWYGTGPGTLNRSFRNSSVFLSAPTPHTSAQPDPSPSSGNPPVIQ